jgi:membrane protein DedA with SNARE-associated domain
MHHILSASGMTDWLSRWSYLGIILCVFIGNLGIPVPEELVLLAAGFLAGRHVLELGTLYSVAILSAVAGDSCGFLVGRTGGRRLFVGLSQKSSLLRKRYKHLRTFFRVHGNKAVFLGRFIMGVRFIAGPMAGAAGMGFWGFLAWNLLGACIWCSVVITIGTLSAISWIGWHMCYARVASGWRQQLSWPSLQYGYFGGMYTIGATLKLDKLAL